MKRIKSKYTKAFFALLTGTIVAQIITLLFSPLLSRIYSAEEMGIFTLILSVVNMFGGVICARYELVIISAKNEKDVYRLIPISLIMTLIFSFLVTIGFLIYVNYIPDLKKALGYWSLLIFPILLIQGLINILTAYNNRFKEYGLISRVNIIRVSVQGTMQLGFGLLNFGVLGLLISYFVSTTMGVRRQFNRLKQNLFEFNEITYKQLKIIMAKYKDQPMYSVPAIFLNSAAYSILPFMLNSLYGATEVGFFSISFRVLGIPLALISTNVSRIFFQRASEEFNSGNNFRKTFLGTTIILVLIALPLSSFLYFFGQDIIVKVFGANWDGAGKFIKAFSFMYGIRLVVSALSITLVIVEKQKYDLILQSFFFFATIITFIVAKFYMMDIIYFILIISVLYSINYLIYWIISYKFSEGKIKI